MTAVDALRRVDAVTVGEAGRGIGAGPVTLAGILAAGAVHSVFQPIVDLTSGAVTGYEALARGPHGYWESPDRLFTAARDQGLVTALDLTCRRAAFTGAVAHRLQLPLTLFVNVEPDALDVSVLEATLAEYQRLTEGLQVVVEFTERALGANPAALLATVDRVRALGWGIALDDVGAHPLSLAFMSLLRPDVVKLDLRLVQQHPGPEVAQIMNAVNAYAERAGAVILAEGIETDHHLTMARALGATLGQGWLLGRPVSNPRPAPAHAVSQLGLPVPPWRQLARPATPFGCLPPDLVLRQARKSLLIEVSKQLEAEALRLGPTAIVASTFQHTRHFTPATATRYRNLAARVGYLAVLGENLPPHLGPRLRGTPLAAGDPVCGEWDLVVLHPHFAVALLARDLGDTGSDLDRTFEFALTYNRGTVEHATHALLAKVADATRPSHHLDGESELASATSEPPR